MGGSLLYFTLSKQNQAGALIPFAAMIAVIACLAAGGATAQQGPPPVDVAQPLRAEVVDWDEYTGRFEAVDRVELRARVSGYLEAVRFRDGQIVTKGDLLFKIDPRPFQAALARAEADLQAAKADQTRADQELARARQLVRNRTVSESALDEREAAKLRADAAVAGAEAQVRAAELDLEFSEVRAPITGRISDRRIDVGNLVSGGEAGQASLLATIVSTDPIYFVFNASEADFLKYARLAEEGRRDTSRDVRNVVFVRLRDETGFTRRGFMDFVDIELDPNAGTIRGRAEFQNATGFLTPGLFGRLRLIGSKPYEARLLPDAAILSDQARKIVMTVGDGGVVTPKVVTLGPIYRGLRVIRSGLTGDEQVVVAGLLRARPGGSVTPNTVALSFPEPAPNLPID